MCSVKLCVLGLLLTFATCAQCTGICNSCVYLPQCTPVLRILDSFPYSTQSYFFAAVTCGYVGGDALVCCDSDVIRQALVAEETSADAHRDTFEDEFDIHDYAFGIPMSGHLAPQTEEEYTGLIQDQESSDVPEYLIQRLKEEGTSSLKGNRVNDAVCGSNTKFRIIGGEEASTGMFPWMARLGYRVRSSVDDSTVNYRCGGALVSARHVLTAAHCLVRLPQSTYLAVVKLGTDGTPTQSFAPERIVTHPEYNTPRLQNDIALVHLDRPAIYTETIMPICLPFGEFTVNLNRLPPRSMLVAGWGSTDADSSALSPTLQFVRLTYQERGECARVYAERFNLTIGPNQICTVGEKDRDSCGGDSGGPVFVWSADGGGARAVGLVSFGARRCGTRGVPTVYTRIDAYRLWIEDNVAR